MKFQFIVLGILVFPEYFGILETAAVFGPIDDLIGIPQPMTKMPKSDRTSKMRKPKKESESLDSNIFSQKENKDSTDLNEGETTDQIKESKQTSKKSKIISEKNERTNRGQFFETEKTTMTEEDDGRSKDKYGTVSKTYVLKTTNTGGDDNRNRENSGRSSKTYVEKTTTTDEDDSSRDRARSGKSLDTEKTTTNEEDDDRSKNKYGTVSKTYVLKTTNTGGDDNRNRENSGRSSKTYVEKTTTTDEDDSSRDRSRSGKYLDTVGTRTNEEDNRRSRDRYETYSKTYKNPEDYNPEEVERDIVKIKNAYKTIPESKRPVSNTRTRTMYETQSDKNSELQEPENSEESVAETITTSETRGDTIPEYQRQEFERKATTEQKRKKMKKIITTTKEIDYEDDNEPEFTKIKKSGNRRYTSGYKIGSNPEDTGIIYKTTYENRGPNYDEGDDKYYVRNTKKYKGNSRREYTSTDSDGESGNLDDIEDRNKYSVGRIRKVTTTSDRIVDDDENNEKFTNKGYGHRQSRRWSERKMIKKSDGDNIDEEYKEGRLRSSGSRGKVSGYRSRYPYNNRNREYIIEKSEMQGSDYTDLDDPYSDRTRVYQRQRNYYGPQRRKYYGREEQYSDDNYTKDRNSGKEKIQKQGFGKILTEFL